jgi:transposase
MARDVERDGPLDVSGAGFSGLLEVLAGPTGRAQRSDALKAQIVAESWAPGAKVADVARRHGTTRWQVYKWRHMAKRGELVVPADALEAPAFASIVMEDPPCEAPRATVGGPAMVAPVAAGAPMPATVEIVVGDVVIRAPEAAGAEHLARAIRAARLAVT